MPLAEKTHIRFFFELLLLLLLPGAGTAAALLSLRRTGLLSSLVMARGPPFLAATRR